MSHSSEYDDSRSYFPYSRFESILGVIFPLACGVGVGIFVTLVNQ